MPRLLLLAALAALASGPAAAQIIYVDVDATGAGDGSSWTDAFPSLAIALQVADNPFGSTVWVAEGTYYPDVFSIFADDDRAASFLMPMDVTVYGGFAGTESALSERDWVAHPVVLSGDLDQDGTFTGNAYHVVRNRYSGPGSFSAPADAGTIDGVTITGGNADGSDPDLAGLETFGGGVYLRFGRMTIRNARVTGNRANHSGGGIGVDNGGGQAGGTESSNVTLVNVEVTGNAAQFGAGVRTSSGHLTAVNVTFAGNSGLQGCAAYVQDFNSASAITNAIAWDNPCSNTPGPFAGNGYTLATSLVEFEAGATAPLFYAPEAGDYRLLVGSPGVDLGNTAALPPDAADLDGDADTGEAIPFDAAGDARVQGAAVDAGAYEGAEPFVAHRFTGAAGWRMIAPPADGLTYGDLLDAEWTQNVPGADYEGPLGEPSVFAYDETVTVDTDYDADADPDLDDGWGPLSSLGDTAPLGAGFVFFAFDDTDIPTPGVQGGFPRQSLVEVTPGAVTAFDWNTAGLLTATPSLDGGATFDAVNDGWNLLGNPFEVGMDWDAATSTDVSGSIYVFDPTYNGGDYRAWDGATGDLADGVVPAGQAFWAKATTTTPTLSVDATARVTGRRTYARQREPVVVGLRVEGEVGGQPRADAFFLDLRDDADAGLDATDAFELAPPVATDLSLGSAVGDARLHIDARPASGAVEVPLAVAAVADGALVGADLVLTWPQFQNVPAEWSLTLLDTDTGATVDLRTADRYAFRLAPAAGRVATPDASSAPAFAAIEAPVRFRLLVGAAATGTDEETPTAAVSLARPNPASSRSVLRVTVPSPEPVRAVVYDALGRQVAVAFDGFVAGSAEIIVEAGRLAPGVYVLRIEGTTFAEARALTVVR